MIPIDGGNALEQQTAGLKCIIFTRQKYFTVTCNTKSHDAEYVL